MSVKKFTEFSLKENKEDNMKDKIEDMKKSHSEVNSIENEIPFDSDLEEVEGEDDIEDVDKEDDTTDSFLSDYSDFSDFGKEKDIKNKNVINNESNISSGTKIVIINGCEPDSEIDKKTEEFKSKCGADCKEIFLYQLNIQSPKKHEPKDGMQQIYNELENAHAVVFACTSNKSKLSDNMETAIARIKNFYKKEELKNKIFGAIIIGNEDRVKNDLILTALNDFHMVVCADCLCFCNDKSTSNLSKMMDSITTLSNATALIKSKIDGNIIDNEGGDDDININNIEDEIKPFDEFIDTEQTEDPKEVGLPDDMNMEKESESESDDYVDSLKNDFDLSVDADDETEEDKLEDDAIEDEERLIDNQDGTITQIHKGEKVTENKKIAEDFNIIPFDKFIKNKY